MKTLTLGLDLVLRTVAAEDAEMADFELEVARLFWRSDAAPEIAADHLYED